jgi:hypothetical protein
MTSDQPMATALRFVAFASMFLLGACSAPLPELERPPTRPDASAISLLPPGDSEPASFPQALDGALSTAKGGRHMAAFRFASSDFAAKGFLRLVQGLSSRSAITSQSTFQAGAARYVRYSGQNISGLAWTSGIWLFVAEGRDAAQLAAVVRASRAGGLSQTTERHLVYLLPWLIIGGLITFVGLMILMAKGILRWLASPPVAGVPAASRDKLERRLLALNDKAAPYLVRRGPEADLVVEWKFADANWWGILAKSGVRKAFRLRLYFNVRAHRVYALDELGEVDWSAGLLTAPRVHFKKTFFRGVLSRRERGVAYGFRTPTGGIPVRCSTTNSKSRP